MPYTIFLLSISPFKIVKRLQMCWYDSAKTRNQWGIGVVSKWSMSNRPKCLNRQRNGPVSSTTITITNITNSPIRLFRFIHFFLLLFFSRQSCVSWRIMSSCARVRAKESECGRRYNTSSTKWLYGAFGYMDIGRHERWTSAPAAVPLLVDDVYQWHRLSLSVCVWVFRFHSWKIMFRRAWEK